VQQAAHTLFRGRIGLHQLLRLAFQAKGSGRDAGPAQRGRRPRRCCRRGTTWSRSGIQAEGASNLSIGNILANVLNKFALQGYLYVEQAWREICAIRPVNDFKPTKSINLLGDVMFKQFGPTGELRTPRSATRRSPTRPPRTAASSPSRGRTSSTTTWACSPAPRRRSARAPAWRSTTPSGRCGRRWPPHGNGVAAPNGDDGNAFWRTSSSTTAAAKRAGKAYLPNKTRRRLALSAATLKTGPGALRQPDRPQRQPAGLRRDAMPILLHGPSNWYRPRPAAQLLAIIATAARRRPTSGPTATSWAGTMKPVMSRYIENANYVNSTTAFWILFNPVALPVIEVALPQRRGHPAVLQAGPDYQFDRLGISIRGTMPFGVNQQNFRGGVYNAGA
jgi:hypothetical protein